MATIDKNTIYSWFQTDDFPTEEQFRATWDSFWHKNETIPMSSISGLNQMFQQTATLGQLNAKANIDGSNIDVAAYQSKLQLAQLIATAKQEVKYELLDGAPEAFDTLKEISTWISNNETAEAAILQAIQNETTARTNADNLKLDKPTSTGDTELYPYVVLVNMYGDTVRYNAGDLGKNFFNSDLSNTSVRNHTMNAAVTVDTLGNPHSLKNLPNKNTDIANFRKVRVQNASGLDAVVDSKNLFMDIPNTLSASEKNTWMNGWTGVYSTGVPLVTSVIMPVVEKFNGTVKISIHGSNLYLNPETSYIRFKDKNNFSDWHSVDSWEVVTSNRIDVIVNLNLTNINTEYVFEIKHNTFLYNSIESFLVVSTLTPLDITNLNWTLAKATGADSILTSTRVGNTISENYISRTGTLGSNQDNNPMNVWKSEKLIGVGERGIVNFSFNIDYSTGNFEFPRSYDNLGLAQFINGEVIDIASVSTLKVSIGTAFQNFGNREKQTEITGGAKLAGHVGNVLFYKNNNHIKTILSVGNSSAIYNTIFTTDIDIAAMLVLKGRYLDTKYVGAYQLLNVYKF